MDRPTAASRRKKQRKKNTHTARASSSSASWPPTTRADPTKGLLRVNPRKDGKDTREGPQQQGSIGQDRQAARLSLSSVIDQSAAASE
mmetsp:Transcript_16895/g.54989  ORF Transcript_16895/g.54989 Transcript_16895/m.54989 type:complete len:88 (+) Transcript_16895:788-1051(+)